MDTIGNRVKTVRKADSLTLAKFGNRIGITAASLSNIELGKTNPSDQTIRSICREFKVNEIWLRTGDGEMHQALTENEELAAYLGEVMSDEPESFRRRLTMEMKNWTPEVWRMLEDICKRLSAENKEHPDG